MRCILLFLVALVTFSGTARGGGLTEAGDIQDGSWALQFRVANNFTLSSFTGAAFSGKYHLSPRLALRAGVGVSRQNSDYVISRSFPDTVLADDLTEENNHRYALNLDLLYYTRSEEPVRLFFGGGPVIELYRRDLHRDQLGMQSNIATRKAIGGAARLGVEWFFKNFLSLHAEYGLQLAWFKNEDESTQISNSETTSRISKSEGWSLEETGVLFGLSVYF